MTRSEYTRYMWEQLPVPIRETISLEQTAEQWWHDARDDGGWRLAWNGLVDLTDVLKVESWDFDFTSREIPSWAYLTLKKHVDTPYYLVQNRKHTRITLLDSKLAMMVGLYGDVEKWIASLRA